MLSPDRERVRQILSETIGLLCRNGLSFDFELSVDALIGITIDHNDVFLVSIKDTYDSEKNIQKSNNGDSVMVTQILYDSGQKDGCAKPDSNITRNFLPASKTSNWSHSEKQLSISKQNTPDNVISMQSRCKRTIERNEFLGDQTKKARISEDTSEANSQTRSTLLPTIIKSEPRDDLFTTKASDTLPCGKSPDFDTSHGQCSSRSTLLVNSKLNNTKDLTQVPSYDEDSADQVPDDSHLAKESNPHSPSYCLPHNEDNEVSSQLPLDCNGCSSSLNKQNCSELACKCPAADVITETHNSLLPSSIPTRNYSLATRCSLLAPSVCQSANSETSSDSVTVEDASDKTESRRSRYRRKRSQKDYDARVESGSSDSEVICIKEEISCGPFKSCVSLPVPVDPNPSSLQNNGARYKDDALDLPSGDRLNLESLSCDHSMGWKGEQNGFFHRARRQQKDSWNIWIQDDVMPQAFEDTRSLEKQLTQAAQAILLYDGQYVPLRDIQRLRLCGMAAGQIKMAMERLSSYNGKLGCFQVLHGGVNLFYKCPPNLVDRGILESSYCIPWETYKFHHDVNPASNITTKHNEQYWLKVASSSPYNSSNKAFHSA